MTHTSPPASYSEWLALLDRFRDGDDTVIVAMQNGTLEWTNVVAERWTTRMSDACKIRLERFSVQLQTAMDRAGSDAFMISRAMLAARRALAPLRAVAALSCLPADVREHFSERVTRFAAQTQESLESSANRGRSDGGTMLKAIRDNPLTTVLPPDADREAGPDTAPSKPGRRWIL